MLLLLLLLFLQGSAAQVRDLSCLGDVDVMTAAGHDPQDRYEDVDIPMLPLHHPSNLITQLSAGKITRVQRILGHVASCIK